MGPARQGPYGTGDGCLSSRDRGAPERAPVGYSAGSGRRRIAFVRDLRAF